MALDKNILGPAIKAVLDAYDNLTNDQLIAAHGDLESARTAVCVDLAGAIIDHFKNHGVLNVPGTGLVAGATAVTGESVTGNLV